MAGWRLLLAGAFVALPFWFAATSPVHACSCAGGFEPTYHAQHDDAVVLGTARDVRLLETQPTPTIELTPDYLADSYHIDAEVVWHVDVEQYIKGTGAETLEVHSSSIVTIGPGDRVQIYRGGNPMCGFAPESDARYLLFLRRGEDGLYHTSQCEGNWQVLPENEARVEAFILEIRQALVTPSPQPTVVLPPTGDGGARTSGPVWAVVSTGVAGVALLSAAWLVRRRVATST